MKNARESIREMLFEQQMDKAYILDKAEAENLEIQDLRQAGLTITIQLAEPAGENAIRRFKTQLRIRNPRLERIEVRQPKENAAADALQPDEEDAEKPREDPYVSWRNSMLRKLGALAKESGWDFYTAPHAGKRTEYFLFTTGSGKGKRVFRVRLSEHPSWREDADVSIDMTDQEADVEDLEVMLRNART